MQSRLRRFLGLTLLLLALSPATQPFATFDIADLFGETGSPAVSVKTPKATVDQSVATAGSFDTPRLAEAGRLERPFDRRHSRPASTTTHRQLRI